MTHNWYHPIILNHIIWYNDTDTDTLVQSALLSTESADLTVTTWHKGRTFRTKLGHQRCRIWALQSSKEFDIEGCKHGHQRLAHVKKINSVASQCIEGVLLCVSDTTPMLLDIVSLKQQPLNSRDWSGTSSKPVLAVASQAAHAFIQRCQTPGQTLWPQMGSSWWSLAIYTNRFWKQSQPN